MARSDFVLGRVKTRAAAYKAQKLGKPTTVTAYRLRNGKMRYTDPVVGKPGRRSPYSCYRVRVYLKHA